MYIIITKNPPISKSHFIVKGGLYKVYREKEDKYKIKSYITDTGIWINKDECKQISGKPKLRYSHLAQTIKYLELKRWSDISGDNIRKFDGTISIEEKMYTSFKYHSAFCHIFRKFKVNQSDDIRYCYCPMKPYEHKEWPTTEHNGVKRKNCLMIKVNGENKFLPEKELLKRIQSISIEEIVEMLKEIKIPNNIMSMLKGYWFSYLWYKIKKDKIIL